MRPRIPILALVGAAALGTSTHPTHAAEARRPNVLFILTDDQGWGDAHFAGHPYVKTAPPAGIGGNNNEDRPKKTYPASWDADQLYDLCADPKEQRNLAKDPAHAAKLEELKRELRRHLETLPGGFGELKPAR